MPSAPAPAPALPPLGPVVTEAGGTWCALPERGFNDEWRSLTSAGTTGLAPTGSMKRPPWRTEVYVFDRYRWADAVFDLDVRFAAERDGLYLGGARDGGGAFLVHDKDARTHRELATDGMVTSGLATWAGDDLVVWNGSAGARYSVARDRWQPIASAAPPDVGPLVSTSWNGTELIALSTSRLTKQPMTTLAYAPSTDAWRTVDTPFHYPFGAPVVADDGVVYAAVGVLQPQGWQTISLFQLRPSATAWVEVAPLASTACDLMPAALAHHAGALLLFGDDGRACARDLATGAMTAITGLGGPGAQYAWLGDVMLAVRNEWNDDELRGEMYRPPTPRATTAFLYHPAGTRLSPVCQR